MQTSTRLAGPATPGLRQRLPRLLLGLVIAGVGIALMVRADLGLGPWDVLHQGISRLTGVPIGRITILTGLAVLLVWVPLRERPGIGTVLNVLLIGTTVDLTMAVVPAPSALWLRSCLVIGGVVIFALGSSLYIGAGLGPGPRDGVMTGFARRGFAIGAVRTTLEVLVLVVGLLLGGTIGLGTVLFAFGVGPLIHVMLPRLTLEGRLAPA